jgi:phage terminase large subunit
MTNQSKTVLEKVKMAYRKEYFPALANDKRYFLICGGRAGGRSYFASQYAVASLIQKPYFRCAIMRFVQGDVRDSIFQEIKDRIEELGMENQFRIQNSLIITNPLNNSFCKGKGFRKSSGDQKAKLKSLAGYTDVIIEEAEEVSEEDFQKLDDSLRTIKGNIRVFLLFNLPPKDHWINKRWFNLVESSEVSDYYEVSLKESVKYNTVLVHTTYLDNLENLNQSTINNFEAYKTKNPDHYWNMIMGLVPTGKRGLIYKTWNPISVEEFNKLPYSSFYGLDFGYSNDPTALLEIKTHNDDVWVRELIYQTGLTNQDISQKMWDFKIYRGAYIYGDSAEPKSIEEIKRLGWNIHPADKGQGSIKAGISKLLEKNVHYTDDSLNLIKERENYSWALDKDKNPTNNPIDDFNHCMDALRYGVFTNANKKRIGFF